MTLYIPGYSLRKYQEDGIDLMMKRGSLGLILDPGMGKTRMILEVIKRLKCKAIVVTKKSIMEELVWPNEIDKWMIPVKWKNLHDKTLNIDISPKIDLIITNFDSLWFILENLNPLVKMGFKMLVIDESTDIKRPNTIRFKTLKKIVLSNKFKYKFILTGSFISNSLLEIWSQVFVLDSGLSLGRSFSKFKTTWFYKTFMNKYKIRSKTAADEIKKKVRHLTFSVEPEKYIDLVDIYKTIHELEMTPKIKEVYTEMLRKFIVEIEENKVTAKNAGVKSSKLRQIVSGFLYGPNKEIIKLHELKINKLIDIIEGAVDSKIIVPYWFTADGIMIKDRLDKLGLSNVIYNTHEDMEDWKGDKYQILLAQQNRISHGLNLQTYCHIMIWYSIYFRWDSHDQAIKRIHRPGQEYPVLVHYIFLKHSIDYLIYDSIKEGKAIQVDLLHYLRMINNSRYSPIGDI